MAMLIPRHRRRLGPGSVVAALDIGTSKVCCLIAAVEPGHGRFVRRVANDERLL